MQLNHDNRIEIAPRSFGSGGSSPTEQNSMPNECQSQDAAASYQTSSAKTESFVFESALDANDKFVVEPPDDVAPPRPSLQTETPEVSGNDWEALSAAAGLYETLIQPGELSVVLAESGGHKTNLVCNLASFAASCGGPVIFFNADLPLKNIQHRIRSMLHGYTTGQLEEKLSEKEAYKRCHENPKVLAHWNNIQFIDVSIERETTQRWSQQIEVAIQKSERKPVLIVVDGSEKVAFARYGRNEFDELFTELSTLAAKHNVSVWTTSQVQKEADGAELVTKSQAAFSREKVYRAGMVLTIGSRVESSVLTVCIDKDRNNVGEDKRVNRFRLTPSLVMSVILDSSYRLKPCAGFSNREIITVGVGSGDLPRDDDSEGDDGDADKPAGPHKLLKPFHGLKGFVPVGREVFVSAIYQNRDKEAFFYLMDLYSMAQIAPAAPYAPGTSIAVPLQRGEVSISLSILASRWNVSRGKIKRLLKMFRANGLISVAKVMADGKRFPVASLDDGDTSSGTKTRTIAQVIKCLHYPAKIAEERE